MRDVTEMPPPSRSADDRGKVYKELPPRGAVQWSLKIARMTMLLGVVSLFLAATALLVIGFLGTVRHVSDLITSGNGLLDNQATILASIKLVDVVLIATIVQVVAFGLYSLFVDPDLRIPDWLRTSDPEDLKKKLAGIVIIMLGVLFLEEAIHWRSERDLLSFGLAIAAIVFALGYFSRTP